MDEPIRPKAGTIEALNPDGTVDVRVGPRVLGRTMGDARPTFCGVPFAEFCTRDRQYVEDAVATGAVGIVGLCAACSAKCDAASEAAAAADGEAAPEHPAPWRWEGDELLADANGGAVLVANDYGELTRDEAVKALVAAAPEMLALVRRLVAGRFNDWNEVEHAREDLRALLSEARALLARLDPTAPAPGDGVLEGKP